MRAGRGYECQLFRAPWAWGVRARRREGEESRDPRSITSTLPALRRHLGPRDIPSQGGDLGGARRSAQVCWRRSRPTAFPYQTKGTFLLKCFACGAASKERRVTEGGGGKKKTDSREEPGTKFELFVCWWRGRKENSERR